MFIGEERAGEVWADCTYNHEGSVTIGEDGWGVFPVNGGSVSVWALSDAEEEQSAAEAQKDTKDATERSKKDGSSTAGNAKE
ncbi:Glucan 1,4-alpha-maltohexaosidase precursor [compost metagenome]